MPGQVSSAESPVGNAGGSNGGDIIGGGISVTAIVAISVAAVIGLFLFLKFRKK